MQRNVNDGLGFGIFEKVDKDLGLSGDAFLGWSWVTRFMQISLYSMMFVVHQI